MSPELHIDRARIFVSFADEDHARAMQIVRWLNDSGWHVVADDRHAFAVGSWSPSPRLDACDVILCVVTPGWLASDFCHREFSYCAKRGCFVLPVICELSDIGLLPRALRALPRVDLTRNRMIDYLALKEVLTQAGTKAGTKAARAAVPDNPEGRGAVAWMFGRRLHVWLLSAILALAAIATLGLWAWR
jgi:hypothetical protein